MRKCELVELLKSFDDSDTIVFQGRDSFGVPALYEVDSVRRPTAISRRVALYSDTDKEVEE